jgi:hypothetical protein
MSGVSDAEEAFAAEIEAFAPEREHRFDTGGRRWRFDFAWPAVKLAVEIEGRGRHQSVVGYRADCEKYNAAVAQGWRVMRFPATDWKPSRSRKQWPGGAQDWAIEVVAVICNAR